MSKRSTRPSRFSQARSHELNDAYMEEFETGFEELRLANGGSKRNTSQANKKSNGYESTSGRQQLVQHNRGKANSAARKVGIGFRHGYEINSKHLAHGWKRGPSNPAGNLFDASDRNILCMSLLGNSCVVGSADHGLKEFDIETCKMKRKTTLNKNPNF